MKPFFKNMEISRSNIEYYLTLYFDRKLDPVKTAELMLFLSKNPDLESLIELPKGLSLTSEPNKFPHKHLLKKDFQDVSAITDKNFDEFCIASAEGLLCDNDEKRLKQFIELHPEREKDARIFRLLKVEADLQVRYPDKSALKRPLSTFRNRWTWITVTGIAAAVALALLLIKDNSYRITGSGQFMAQDQVQELNLDPAPLQQAESYPGTGNQTNIAVLPSTENENPSVAIESRRSVGPLPESVSAASLSSASLAVHNDILLEPIDPLHHIQLNALDLSDGLNYASGSGTISRNGNTLYASQDVTETGKRVKGLMDLVRDLDAWKTTLFAVKGFNALTESSISLDKTMDNQGRMTGLIIDTDSYTLLAKGSDQEL